MTQLVLLLCVALVAVRAVPLGGPESTGTTVPDSGAPEWVPNTTEEAGFISLSGDDVSPESTHVSDSSTQSAPWSGWIYRALSEGMLKFTVTSEEPKCSEDGRLYRQNLNNLTLWATRMFDASALAPNGFVSADTYQFGHFDECVSIEAPEHQITGKYCLATIKFGPDPRIRPEFYSPPAPLYTELPASSMVWDRLKTTKDPRILKRDVLHWAVCVPSSCGASDIQTSLNATLSGPFQEQGIMAEITINKDDCYSYWEEPSYSFGYFSVMGALYLMGLLVIGATLLDYGLGHLNNMNFSMKYYLKIFSAYSNMRRLTKTTPEADFKLLHCMKFLSMISVILGHKEMYRFGQPMQNSSFIEDFTRYVSSMIFLNGGNYIVDTFFVFSGFLTCHYVTKELEKRKNLNLFLVILAKLVRILPVYIFVIAFHAVVLPYLGTGPLWNSLVWREALRCQKNWWANLLFLNNYVDVEDMCMLQSWYLACDMHFFLIGIFLVYTTFKYPKIGSALIAVLFAVSFSLPAYITYVNQYKGVVQLYPELEKDPVSSEHFRSMYVPSHARFVPYMVGIISAYVYHFLIRRAIKIPVPWLFVLIPLGVVINLTTTFIAFVFYMEERPYSLFESVFYVGVHRILWAVTIIGFIIIDMTTGIGKWGSIFRHPAWAPLGRLTYCAFLIHTVPMLYTQGQIRTPPYHSRMMASMTILGEVSLAFFFALILNLVIESPFQRIQKMLFRNLFGAPKKSGLTQKNIAQTVDSQINLTCGISKISLNGERDSRISFTDGSGSTLSFRDENGMFRG